MPVITLPDGSQRAFDNPVTIFDVAMDIGPGLAKAALAGKVGGQVVDTSYLIEQDVERVTHESTPKTLKRIGADIERLVLARAVKNHLNNQIIVAGNRAIVFPEAGE